MIQNEGDSSKSPGAFRRRRSTRTGKARSWMRTREATEVPDRALRGEELSEMELTCQETRSGCARDTVFFVVRCSVRRSGALLLRGSSGCVGSGYLRGEEETGVVGALETGMCMRLCRSQFI